MTEITFKSTMDVTLIDSMGTDETVARAARVSTGRDQLEQGKIEGLINYLVREGHTSTLEHCVLTFRVEAPFFVRDQMVRHRTISYNIESARYKAFDPVFYVPEFERPLHNLGNGAHPKFEPNDNHIDHRLLVGCLKVSYKEAWAQYEKLVNVGIATEVARNVLPVATYTSFYATANLNNWFKFLTLRNGEKGAPQHEVVTVAKKIEKVIADRFPITYEAWRKTL